MSRKLSTLKKSLWLVPSLLPLLSGTAHAQAISNILSPADPITASSVNSPSSESVANAIDGTEAKYLNFDGATGPSGFIVEAGPTLVQGLGMESANDSGPGSDDRDPAIVTVEGSNDPNAINSWTASTNWTLIYSNNTPSFSNRFEWQYFYFTNSLEFTTYRWTAVTCQGPGNNSMQIAEVQLLGSTVPTNAVPPPTFTLTVIDGSGSGSFPADANVSITANVAPAGEVFDNWTGATVANPLAASTTLVMPDSNVTVTAVYGPAPPTYLLTVINGAGGGYFAANATVPITANAAPTGQVFEDWTGAVVAYPQSPSTTLIMPAAATTVTANFGAPPPGISNILSPTDPITASSVNSPTSMSVANAIDGTEAKYLNFDGATGPCGFIVEAGPTLVQGLGMESANDAGAGTGYDRDPAIVTIEGSNDTNAINGWTASTNWALIYSNNTPLFTNRFEWQYFYFTNFLPFTTYRWTAVTCQGPANNSMQIAEVQLLGSTVQRLSASSAPGVLRPTLTASAAAGVLTISWTPAGGSLQSSPRFAPGATWTTVGSANPATVTIGSGASFFRVVSP
jgi:lipid-A-disaccharide synthase-like uncharacterized protein